MRSHPIGSLEVSIVGLGCNNFGGRLDRAGSIEVVHAALDAGITFFDTADVYGGTRSEVFLGAALGARRDDVVVATKFGMPVDADRGGARPDYVMRALEDTLRRLGTDRVDLYQLHQPDPDTPIADTLAALDDCVRAGLVRQIGCSNFSATQLAEADTAVAEGAARFVSVQNQYNLLHRDPERDVLPECERRGIAFIPYYPLASGLLTGKYRRGEPPPTGTRLAGMEPGRREAVLSERNLDVVERLTVYARDHGHDTAALAVAWSAAHRPVASVIAGAMSPAQVAANVAAGDWELTPAQVEEIDALTVAPPA
jgi:aryl-alcohol dehydrogenase-like predicted oxidoreductase